MPEKVLVVDDEEGIVEFIEMSLRREQYDVLKAYTGREALDSVKRDEPDLVLLDIGLPDIDGFEVCRQIRAFSELPIIMVTASGAKDTAIKAISLGAQAYLLKPFDVEELAQVIASCFRT